MILARQNPFSTDRVLRQRYALDHKGWESLLRRLKQNDHRGALVGPHGSGKTTLLEDLATRLSAVGWRVDLRRLSAEFPHLKSSDLRPRKANEFVLLDGAEQLSLFFWWRFRHATREAGGLVITTHRAGRLPTLRRCATDPQLLREIVKELGVALPENEVSALYIRHRGNIREALRELYDRAGCFGLCRERIER